MTYCENCHCHLCSNRAISRHLEEVHGIKVRLEDSLMVYCEECRRYITHCKPRCNERKLALERHLLLRHNINIHEDQTKEYTLKMTDIEDDLEHMKQAAAMKK